MFYAYIKFPSIEEGEGQIIRIGSATEAHLEGKLEGYIEQGFTLSSPQEYLDAGNEPLDDTDETPNEGDAAGMTNAGAEEETVEDESTEVEA